MGPQHCPHGVPAYTQFRLIRPMCTYVPSRSPVVSSIDFFPVAAISRTVWLPRVHELELPIEVIHDRIQDMETNMSIILPPPPPTAWVFPLPVAGVFQSGILHRRRQLLLLPSINTEEIVKFWWIRRKRRNHLQSLLQDLSHQSLKVCR